MTLALPLAAGGDAVAVDDSGTITAYLAAMPRTDVGVATAAGVPTSFGPGGIPVAGSGRVAYEQGAVAYVSSGTPYTANHAIALGDPPVAYFDQGMPYNAQGQLVAMGIGPPDTTPPVVTMTSPSAGTVTGTITISATATDDKGVVGVQFLLDGNAIGPEDLVAPYTMTLDTFLVANGAHNITARARDAAGNTGTATPVAVTVNNFTPANLFAAGEQGFWIDPSDLSTLFQDSAGTVPVTAPGQPVGRLTDKSGRGNHIIQATANKRPTYQVDAQGRGYIQFDGTDDSMATPGVLAAALGQCATVWAGLSRVTKTGTGSVVVESSVSSSSNNGCFMMRSPTVFESSDVGWRDRGTAQADLTATGLTEPIDMVATGESSANAAASYMELRVNGTSRASNTTNLGTLVHGTYQIFVGARNNNASFYTQRMYGLIVRGTAARMTAGDRNSIEHWLGLKMGLNL